MDSTGTMVGKAKTISACHFLDCAREATSGDADDEEMGDGSDEDGGENPKKKAKSDIEKTKIWFDKEVKISEAYEAQIEWRDSMRKTLKAQHTAGVEMCKDTLACTNSFHHTSSRPFVLSSSRMPFSCVDVQGRQA